jgi:hypothetical protein
MNRYITQPDISRDPRQAALFTTLGEAAYLWSRTSLLKEVWDVVRAVKAWPGLTISPNWSGVCLALRGVSLGHVRWDGRIDLPFGPELRDRLVAEEMASRDPDTDGLMFDVRTTADVGRAVWLLRLAYLNVDPLVNELPGCSRPSPSEMLGARGGL